MIFFFLDKRSRLSDKERESSSYPLLFLSQFSFPPTHRRRWRPCVTGRRSRRPGARPREGPGPRHRGRRPVHFFRVPRKNARAQSRLKKKIEKEKKEESISIAPATHHLQTHLDGLCSAPLGREGSCAHSGHGDGSVRGAEAVRRGTAVSRGNEVCCRGIAPFRRRRHTHLFSSD